MSRDHFDLTNGRRTVDDPSELATVTNPPEASDSGHKKERSSETSKLTAS